MRWIALAAMLLTTGCAQIALHQPPLIKSGQIFEAALPYAGKRVPLPPGKWRALDETRYENNLGQSIGFLFLIQTDEARRLVTGVIAINSDIGTVAQSGNGYSLLAQCSRKDIHVTRVAENFLYGEQDCWFVNHVIVASTSTTADVFQKSLLDMRALGYQTPTTAIQAGFRRASRYSFLTVFYYFSPEAEGFPADQSAWLTSGWHRDHIERHPDRKAYVDKLIAWSDAWAPSFRKGFSNH